MGWFHRLLDHFASSDSSSTSKNVEVTLSKLSNVQSCPHSEPYIILDTETTGLEAQDEAIIQLSAIKYGCDGKAIDCFSTYLNPGRNIPSNITQLTGITNRMVAKAPTANQIEQDFFSFIGTSLIVGYNIRFDLRFLQCTFKNAFHSCNYVDVLQIARQLFELPNYKLETVSASIGFTPSGQHHNALVDCEAVASILHHVGADLDIWRNQYYVPVKRVEPEFEAGYLPWFNGEELRKQGKYTEALILFDEARSKGYCHPWVYTSYAMLYRRCNEYDKEIAILQEAIDRFDGPESEQFVERQIKAKECKARAKRRKAEELQKEANRQHRAELRRQREAEKAAKPPKEAAYKPVAQYLDDGTLIAEYPSVAEAARIVGISPKSIREAANGRQKHAGGFCWYYANTKN